VVSDDARPDVRSTFGPVSLAYEPELKVTFCGGQLERARRVSRLGSMPCENSILRANWPDSGRRIEFVHLVGPTNSSTGSGRASS
jgi:hypothetical protein